MIAREDWGLVEILQGPHQGDIGYYDDDDESGKAIVYIGDSPFMFDDPYILISRRSLRPYDREAGRGRGEA